MSAAGHSFWCPDASVLPITSLHLTSCAPGAHSYKPADEIRAHFPNIAAQCQAHGLDITRDPIPVAPAQHYMCGGVQVSLFLAAISGVLRHILSAACWPLVSTAPLAASEAGEFY